MVYRLIEYLASMGHSSIWKLICAICVCNILTVGVHLSSTPSISGPGSATGLNNIDGKLRTYFSFKDHFETEQYLSVIKIFDKRRCLTKFRISSHKLKIETGRFTRPLTPLEQRVCDHCLMTIEDEFHF